jgi:hypothetical protein
MVRRFFDNPVARAVNAVATHVMDAPVVGPLVRRNMVTLRYVGRRSGNAVQLPVSYRRSGDGVTIQVMSPGDKRWWRNFLGDGGPVTLVNFDGVDRTGHAVAHRDERGRVSVQVRLSGVR